MGTSGLPDKKVRVGLTRPPLVVDMEQVIHSEKVRAGRGNNPDLQQESSSDYLDVAFRSTVREDVAVDLVEQVRRRLESLSRDRCDQDCATCFTILGIRDNSHRAGEGCQFPLGHKGDDAWKRFKAGLTFEDGYLCFSCLLPTVSVFVCPPRGAALTWPTVVQDQRPRGKMA